VFALVWSLAIGPASAGLVLGYWNLVIPRSDRRHNPREDRVLSSARNFAKMLWVFYQLDTAGFIASRAKRISVALFDRDLCFV
jgi:hypothetical protein